MTLDDEIWALLSRYRDVVAEINNLPHQEKVRLLATFQVWSKDLDPAAGEGGTMNRTMNTENERHAQYVHWVAARAAWAGITVNVVVNVYGEATDRIAVKLSGRSGSVSSLRSIELIVPPPSEDWNPDDDWRET